MELNPKIISASLGAAAGFSVAAGFLKGFGIDAGDVARDVATVVTQGLIGCLPEPSQVCEAGGRLIQVASLLGFGALGGWLGHAVTPAAPEPAPESTPPAAPAEPGA